MLLKDVLPAYLNKIDGWISILSKHVGALTSRSLHDNGSLTNQRGTGITEDCCRQMRASPGFLTDGEDK
mgnify:CR=1 FL=1